MKIDKTVNWNILEWDIWGRWMTNALYKLKLCMHDLFMRARPSIAVRIDGSARCTVDFIFNHSQLAFGRNGALWLYVWSMVAIHPSTGQGTMQVHSISIYDSSTFSICFSFFFHASLLAVALSRHWTSNFWISTLEYTMKRNTLYAFLCWPCHIFVYAHIYDSLSWMESNIVTLTMAMTTTVTGQKVSSCAARALAPRGVNHPFHRTVCRTVERREQLIYIRIEGSTKRKENLQCVVNWDCRWPILVTEQMNHATSDRHHSMKRYFRLRFDGFHNVLRCYHRNDSREHWWTLNTMLGISIDSRINRWIG